MLNFTISKHSDIFLNDVQSLDIIFIQFVFLNNSASPIFIIMVNKTLMSWMIVQLIKLNFMIQYDSECVSDWRNVIPFHEKILMNYFNNSLFGLHDASWYVLRWKLKYSFQHQMLYLNKYNYSERVSERCRCSWF